MAPSQRIASQYVLEVFTQTVTVLCQGHFQKVALNVHAPWNRFIKGSFRSQIFRCNLAARFFQIVLCSEMFYAQRA